MKSVLTEFVVQEQKWRGAHQVLGISIFTGLGFRVRVPTISMESGKRLLIIEVLTAGQKFHPKKKLKEDSQLLYCKSQSTIN